MKKGFSLIELVIVIAVLGLLASITIPNIWGLRRKISTSQVVLNLDSIKTAMDLYSTEHNGNYATTIQPTLEEPQLIDFKRLYPDYLDALPKEEMKEYYWVDYAGNIWSSTIDAPKDVFNSTKSTEWNNISDVVYYNIYTVSEFNPEPRFVRKVTNPKDMDRYVIKSNEKLLISSVDTHGFETAPVGMNYNGVTEDWFSPIIKKEGVFIFEISSDKLLFWDDFSITEDKPDGTKIIYEFAVANENGIFSDFTEDFYSLEPSKSIKIKVFMLSFDNKMPSLLDFRIYSHSGEDDLFYKSSERNENENKIIDIIELNQNETISNIIFPRNKTINSLEKYSNEIPFNLSYRYSTNGINFIPVDSLSEIPRDGGYVAFVREYNNVENIKLLSKEIKKPIIKISQENVLFEYVEIPKIKDIEEVKPTTVPNMPIENNQIQEKPKDPLLLDANWKTTKEFVYYVSSGTNLKSQWLSAEIEDRQPENTRILYYFATSNGFGWSEFTNDFSQLNESKILKIYVAHQVKIEYLNRIKSPENVSIRINGTNGVSNVNLNKPTVSVKLKKDNNLGKDILSNSSNIVWDIEFFDPQNNKIVEYTFGGDKRNRYETPGVYTVTLKVRNELNIWSDEFKYTFEVKDEKPVAVMSTDNLSFVSGIPINWNRDLSYDLDGDEIIAYEWGGDYKANGIYTEGNHTVKLRVMDSENNWSDWVQKTFTVINESNKVDKIDAGDSFSLALMKDKTVLAWGYNSRGQLGDGTTSNKTMPVQVKGLSNVKKISAGTEHALALLEDGTVMAWGSNKRGQLGDNTKTDRTTPVKVKDLENVKDIAAGGEHSLALLEDGTVVSWGHNLRGQLGDGTLFSRINPVKVNDLSDVIEIDAGIDHSLALLKDGTVMSWGYNLRGQLGDGTLLSRLTPVKVKNLSNVSSIMAGAEHSFALLNNGTVMSWGYNLRGQLGDGTFITRLSPVYVKALSNVIAISAGEEHSIGLLENGTIATWGYNQRGQLGDGTTTNKYTPVEIAGISNITKVSAGSNHTLVLLNDDTIMSWGYNQRGQLGDGTTSGKTKPIKTKGLPQ